VVLDSLKQHNHPEIDALVSKLDEWRILPLMTFQKPWNAEIICQFWATLWIDAEWKVLHWMTQGTHYHCDYKTFSRLLGFDHLDREVPSLFDIFGQGVDLDDLESTQMYKARKPADGTTTHLKPYFYVLNNLLRRTIDPKIGDTIHIQADAPKILVQFGALGGRFSVSDFM
jgi:hypothetical protein